MCKIIVDRSIRPDVRATAIKCVGKHRNVLLAMCDVLDDTSPACKKEYTSYVQKRISIFRPYSDKDGQTVGKKQMEKDPDASKTIGELALARLEKATKKISARIVRDGESGLRRM